MTHLMVGVTMIIDFFLRTSIRQRKDVLLQDNWQACLFDSSLYQVH